MSTDITTVSSDQCEIIASYALGVGGFGSNRLWSCLHYCPCFFNLFIKKQWNRHFQRQFQDELQQYGNEAQRRHMKQQTNSAL